jgi:hypothetical protein
MYSSGRPQPTFSRVDRVFLLEQWDTVSLAGFLPILIDLPNATSDHAPIKLTLHKMALPRS